MRVLFFGTYDARRHPRIEVLMEGLRAHGDTVLECNFPSRLNTAGRVNLLRRPWVLPTFAWDVVRSWFRLIRGARRTQPADAVVVGYLGHLDVHLARRLFTKVPVVLDHLVGLRDTALDRRITGKALLGALGTIDRLALRASELVIVDTREHLELIPSALRPRAIVVPVGAPAIWFQKQESTGTGPLKVVFFGLYTPLQGAPTIGRAIALLIGQPIHFTMIGSGQDYHETRAYAAANEAVTWIDWVDPEELPPLVHEHQVCLGIFGTGPKAQRVSPNKIFQGAAAGCAVVTSDTAPQRRHLGPGGTYVPPGDPEALAQALIQLAEDPSRVGELREAAYRRATEAFSPDVVVSPLRMALLGPDHIPELDE